MNKVEKRFINPFSSMPSDCFFVSAFKSRKKPRSIDTPQGLRELPHPESQLLSPERVYPEKKQESAEGEP